MELSKELSSDRGSQSKTQKPLNPLGQVVPIEPILIDFLFLLSLSIYFYLQSKAAKTIL
jgi:hypothetical protein